MSAFFKPHGCIYRMNPIYPDIHRKRGPGLHGLS
jgi:hypothetical protein